MSHIPAQRNSVKFCDKAYSEYGSVLRGAENAGPWVSAKACIWSLYTRASGRPDVEQAFGLHSAEPRPEPQRTGAGAVQQVIKIAVVGWVVSSPKPPLTVAAAGFLRRHPNAQRSCHS